VLVHRFAWTSAMVVVVGAAAVQDAANGDWLRLLVVGPVIASFGALLGWILTDDRPDRWTWTRRGAVWSGVGALAAYALVAAWGGLGLLVGAALLLTMPSLTRWARAQLLARSCRRSVGPPEDLARPELLRRWEWTTAEVQRDGTTPERRLALVEERRRLLDEIERRDPNGFADWVATAMPDRGRDRPRGGGERPWRPGW
jgi:hypothetical protein